MEAWRKKELWFKHGNGFCIEVSKHLEIVHEEIKREGPNRWCVYAYIYTNHPLFKKIKGTDIFQESLSGIPFHKGCTYVEQKIEPINKEICSYKIGADYHHLHDDEYTYMNNGNEAEQVFDDAERLAMYLEEVWKEREKD